MKFTFSTYISIILHKISRFVELLGEGFRIVWLRCGIAQGGHVTRQFVVNQRQCALSIQQSPPQPDCSAHHIHDISRNELSLRSDLGALSLRFCTTFQLSFSSLSRPEPFYELIFAFSCLIQRVFVCVFNKWQIDETYAGTPKSSDLSGQQIIDGEQRDTSQLRFGLESAEQNTVPTNQRPISQWKMKRQQMNGSLTERRFS